MSKKLLSAVAFAVLSSAALHAGATPTSGITVSGGNEGIFDGPWTLGYQFKATGAITVTALGAYDLGGDGFAVSHDVGLWDASGNLLASTTVSSSDALTDMFRYHSISGVDLTAGETYYVGADNYGYGGDPYLLDADITNSAGATYLTGAYNASDTLAFPVFTFDAHGYFGGNFQYGETSNVPEPASLGLIAAGMLGLTALRRKQSS